MAWSASKPFMAFIEDALENRAAFALDVDNLKAALYDNTITPDQTVVSANTAYNAGVWAGGHVLDAAGWPSIGRQLLSVTSGFTSNIYTLDASDTISANSTTTLTSTYGCQLYDDTLAAPVAKQGIGYLWFGGAAASVANGTFTIIWNSLGILQATG